MADVNSNMDLWNSVCETDPSTTKKVNKRGGFTAVCAQAQRKVATELWGPYGTGWAVKDLQWGEIRDDAVGVGVVQEITLDAVFWYPKGEFPLSVDATYKAGNDTRKKLLTDLTTKALSMLGFNSDVFEGKYDDNKYVAELNKKYDVKETSLDMDSQEQRVNDNW